MQGNASKGSIFTYDKLEKEAQKLDKAIENYLSELEQNDHSETALPAHENKPLPEKLAPLKERQARCQERLKKLEEGEAQPVSETDPDARLLNKRGQTLAGYNVQMAVDVKHKLIIHNEVVQDGNDTQQLEAMALKAKEILEAETLTVNADKGYENHAHIKNCEEAGITPYVPLADKAAPIRAEGRFTHAELTYDVTTDSYRCPADKMLSRQGTQNKRGQKRGRYASKASECEQCPLRQQCLPKKTPYRQLYRWEHQDVIDRHRARMEQNGREHMRRRAATVEHPFGTMKVNMGWQHFLMRGLEKVQAEMN